MKLKIVKIIPLTRMPKNLGFFDYKIPDKLHKTVLPGQLVKIPFRKQDVFGLVGSSVAEKADNTESKRLKSILEIISKTPLVETNHIDFLGTMSQLYGVSISTLAKMSLLPLQKGKLDKIDLNSLPKSSAITQPTEPITAYHHYRSTTEHKESLHEVLSESLGGSTLVLVPELHHLDEIHKLLSVNYQKKTVVWHGSLTTKQKFTRWMQIRNGEKSIILASRTGIFLPIPNLKSIIIDFEQHPNHKHWDQTPRFHAKDAARVLSQITGAKLYLMSFSPSCDSYFYVAKEKFKSPNFLLSKRPSKEIKVIDLTEERRAGRFGFMADEIKEAVLKAEGDVFLYLNRLGFSTSVGCNTCGYVGRCKKCELAFVYHQNTNQLRCHYCNQSTSADFNCPNCRSKIVQLRGVGTEFVENGVRSLLGNKLKHEIIRIDSELKGNLPYTRKPRIIVGTQMAIPHINRKKTELVVFTDIDTELNLPEYRSSENVWHKIQAVIFRLDLTSCNSEKVKFFIQTRNPKHLIFRSLEEPERFYRTDLNARRSLGFPPYSYLVRYFYGDKNTESARESTLMLRQSLTKTLKSAKISQVIEMQPKFYRGKYWYVLIVRLDPKNWQKDLIEINKLVPHDWKIDPNPISLLSP